MFYFDDGKTFTVYFADGNIATWDCNDIIYPQLKSMCEQAKWIELKTLSNLPKAILNENVKIDNDHLNVNGVAVSDKDPLTRLIMKIKEKGLIISDIEHIKPFLMNCLENPYIDAVEEIYDFIVKLDLRITEDGCFLAYKNVGKDLKSIHDGTTLHVPGTTVEVDEFDTNRNNTCSKGLHFCSKDYLNCYPGEVTICVKVNPRDVVSIPVDYNYEKGRCCRYEVVGVMPTNKFFNDIDVEDKFDIKLANEHEYPEDDYDDIEQEDVDYESRPIEDIIDDVMSHFGLESINKRVMDVNTAYESGGLDYASSMFGISPETVKRYVRKYKEFMRNSNG